MEVIVVSNQYSSGITHANLQLTITTKSRLAIARADTNVNYESSPLNVKHIYIYLFKRENTTRETN